MTYVARAHVRTISLRLFSVRRNIPTIVTTDFGSDKVPYIYSFLFITPSRSLASSPLHVNADY